MKTMGKLSLRNQLRRLCELAIFSTSSPLGESELKRSAMVFSPHPDDETLGCGGTIIKRKKANAEVKLVFLTDGSSSHNHLISRLELAAIRENEARAASQLLGLGANDSIFLGFKDGRLEEYKTAVLSKITEILQHEQPDEVFLPYSKDGLSDHIATNQIVTTALKSYGVGTTVYEYPIWFWQHWPWTSLPVTSRWDAFKLLRGSIIAFLRLLRDFRCSAYIGDVLEIKRSVLGQYESQMTRLLKDPNWVTLGDVAHGDFLECFFNEFEVFHRYSVTGTTKGNKPC